MLRVSAQTLYRKIRQAEEPNNPVLIPEYLKLSSENAEGSRSVYRRYLLAQFNLLLDTIADESLPPHWRCLCLDYIHKPLFTLERMADCEQRKQEVRKLFHELRVTGHYLQPGLLA